MRGMILYRCHRSTSRAANHSDLESKPNTADVAVSVYVAKLNSLIYQLCEHLRCGQVHHLIICGESSIGRGIAPAAASVKNALKDAFVFRSQISFSRARCTVAPN
jgi:hypothetical protein